MSDDEIRGNIDELSVDTNDKNQFIRFCKTFMGQLENIKGKASIARMKIEDTLEEQYELIKRRKKADNSVADRASKKIDTLNVQIHLKEKLKEKLGSGKINTNHIQDLLKTGLDDELGKLNTDAQEIILENIENNRNNLTRHNSEEIAAFAVQTDNITRKSLDIWYQGILAACKRVRSLSNPSDESLNNLYNEQIKGLFKEVIDTEKALNYLSSRIKKLPQ